MFTFDICAYGMCALRFTQVGGRGPVDPSPAPGEGRDLGSFSLSPPLWFSGGGFPLIRTTGLPVPLPLPTGHAPEPVSGK